MVPLKYVGENPSLLLSSFWWWSLVLGIYWLVTVSLKSLPLSSHGILSACLRPDFLLLIKIPIIEDSGHLNDLTLTESSKTLFPNEVYIFRYWKLGILHIYFGEGGAEHNSIHTSNHCGIYSELSWQYYSRERTFSEPYHKSGKEIPSTSFPYSLMSQLREKVNKIYSTGVGKKKKTTTTNLCHWRNVCESHSPET